MKIEKVSEDNGVSGDLVYCMYQDSKGFIWFGTMFGLVRYDGSDYKTFRYDPLDSNSLSNDDIISIFEDRDGNIWCGTYFGGLNKYDRKALENSQDICIQRMIRIRSAAILSGI
ncbi:MAG: two-component regulator propeller domain-containing protein [Ignavibacteria bacterium]